MYQCLVPTECQYNPFRSLLNAFSIASESNIQSLWLIRNTDLIHPTSLTIPQAMWTHRGNLKNENARVAVSKFWIYLLSGKITLELVGPYDFACSWKEPCNIPEFLQSIFMEHHWPHVLGIVLRYTVIVKINIFQHMYIVFLHVH